LFDVHVAVIFVVVVVIVVIVVVDIVIVFNIKSWIFRGGMKHSLLGREIIIRIRIIIIIRTIINE
jgi:hypothetical protein